MLEILDEQCTGCTMCGQLCPTGAIQFEIKDGFRYPKVVRNKCINCDLCNKRCPAKNNNIEKNSYKCCIENCIKNELLENSEVNDFDRYLNNHEVNLLVQTSKWLAFS